eukprot:scaffold26437_cov120-Isochrysis_galbana.AAC.2
MRADGAPSGQQRRGLSRRPSQVWLALSLAPAGTDPSGGRGQLLAGRWPARRASWSTDEGARGRAGGGREQRRGGVEAQGAAKRVRHRAPPIDKRKCGQVVTRE